MSFSDPRAVWNVAKTLHKKSSRDESGLFLIEGRREIDLAMAGGIEIIQILDRSNTSARNMERISYCGEVVAVAKMPDKGYESLQGFEVPGNPLILVLDKLEKPGNIGAIIRTAEAAGVSAVFVCDGAGDIGNPNMIRASLGAVFSLPVFCVSSLEAATFLEQHEIPVVVASPDAAKNYFEYDFTGAVAIVVGSEADGVSKFWAQKAFECVTIPMTGAVNSLNVSVSAAILIYEAVSKRLKLQRNKNL